MDSMTPGSKHEHQFGFVRHSPEDLSTKYSCHCGARAYRPWHNGNPLGPFVIYHDPVYLVPAEQLTFEAQVFDLELLR